MRTTQTGSPGAAFACVLAFALGMAQAEAADIAYRAQVHLKVGQQAILKGVRGAECGGKPPDWSSLKAGLPTTDLGTFSDGGTGQTNSKRCGGSTPARAVMFKAAKAGKARLVIYEDPVSIVVD